MAVHSSDSGFNFQVGFFCVGECDVESDDQNSVKSFESVFLGQIQGAGCSIVCAY